MTLSDSLAAIGLAVTVIGFVITLVQIWRVKTVAKATKAALGDATGRLTVYNFLLVVPELARIDGDLEDAVLRNDPDATRRCLREWREAVGTVQGILERAGRSDDDLQKAIRDSLVKVGVAKRALVNAGATDMIGSTKKARESIERVCSESHRVAASIRASASSEGLLLVDSLEQNGKSNQ